MTQAPQVQTVLGPVDADRLGRVLMHEHVFVLTEEVRQNYPEEWGDEDARVAEAVARLRELPAHGIGTIVDVTVIGQGRDIGRIERIARQVPGLNIVVATGIYTFDDVPLFFSRRPRRTMTDFFIRDITEGIAGTGVKAGMLKCAVDEKGLTRGTERVLRAVAEAHRETGTPITIHTHAAGQHGTAILDVLTAEGADLSRVVLGHSGDSKDPDYLTEIAESGIILGMDRFGIDHFATFTERADLVVELCHRGLAGQLVLSHDCSVYLDWFSPGTLDGLKDWHYLHISQDVLPYLRENGVTDAQIDAMLVTTPARILAGPLVRRAARRNSSPLSRTDHPVSPAPTSWGPSRDHPGGSTRSFTSSEASSSPQCRQVIAVVRSWPQLWAKTAGGESTAHLSPQSRRA